MNWVLLVIGLMFAVVAIGLWYWRSRVGAEMALMAATETSNARDVAGKAPGTLVELKGNIRAPAPLTSEFAEKPCVWYRALTEREVERRETGSDGKVETKREYETETDVVKAADGVAVADATGSVPIVFEGASVEGEQVHRRTESAGIGQSLVSGLLGGGTLGYRYTEWVIAPDAPVYVLATALAGGAVGKSTGKKQPFVVSIKSEEERTKSLGRSRIWMAIGAGVCALVALALFYGAFAAGA